MTDVFLYRHEYKAQINNESLQFRCWASILLVHKRTDLAWRRDKTWGHSGLKRGAKEMALQMTWTAMKSWPETALALAKFGRHWSSARFHAH
jgi:hypothetical protein